MGLFGRKNKQKAEIDEAIKQNDIPIKFNKNKIKDFLIKSIGAITDQADVRTKFKRPEYNL